MNGHTAMKDAQEWAFNSPAAKMIPALLYVTSHITVRAQQVCDPRFGTVAELQVSRLQRDGVRISCYALDSVDRAALDLVGTTVL